VAETEILEQWNTEVFETRTFSDLEEKKRKFSRKIELHQTTS